MAGGSTAVSCSVCTCTHHAAIHDTSGDGIGRCLAQAGCDCQAFELLDVVALARARNTRRVHADSDGAGEQQASTAGERRQ
jgi:hypothetical protein